MIRADKITNSVASPERPLAAEAPAAQHASGSDLAPGAICGEHTSRKHESCATPLGLAGPVVLDRSSSGVQPKRVCAKNTPASSQLQIGTWNVEGLTDLKLAHLQYVMERDGIDLLCLQETRKRN